MTDAIDAHLTTAREVMAEGRKLDARNSYARAAALYRSNGQGASLDMADALRLSALALDGLRRAAPARAA